MLSKTNGRNPASVDSGWERFCLCYLAWLLRVRGLCVLPLTLMAVAGSSGYLNGKWMPGCPTWPWYWNCVRLCTRCPLFQKPFFLGILRRLVILLYCCHWKGELLLDTNSWTVLAFQIEEQAGGMAHRSRTLSLRGSESHSQPYGLPPVTRSGESCVLLAPVDTRHTWCTDRHGGKHT